MMGQANEWSQWGELWRDQPAVDVALLRRQASRKRWRMRGMVILEVIMSLIASGQCLWLMTRTTGRWQLWSVASLSLVILLQAWYLHVRRGTWRASGDSVSSLLRLTLQRAESGIRLARMNLWSTLAWAGFTLLVSLPELEPSRWEVDQKLKLTLILQFAVNAPLILAIVAVCVWYIRRQRMRIEHVRALLTQES